MLTGSTSAALRRSSRVPTELPIQVTTLSGTYFSEVCKTLVVNAHGCAVLSPMKFDAGIPLRFKSKDGRETTARVVSCEPMGSDSRGWRLGAKLDRPENFWGLNSCPADWVVPPGPLSAKLQQINVTAGLPAAKKANGQASMPPEVLLDLVARRLEAPMRRMIAESLSPIEAQISALKETLARREANPSRFEVSLSQIPPELEQQIEARVKKDLGPKLLEDSRQQNAELLSSAKTAIDQRTIEGYEDFRRRASEELKAVEKRAQEISAQITVNTQEQLRRGLADFQRQLLDGGNSLKRLSEELLEYLQNSSNEEHNAHRNDLEQIRASVAAESSRLRKEVESLDTRMAKLDESARSLESGLDKRLGEMAGNVVRDTRGHLESMANEALGQFAVHSAKTLDEQLTDLNAKMSSAGQSTIASANESLNSQVTDASRAFERSMDEMARLSVERWRLKLATGLNKLATSIGEQFPLNTESIDDANESQ
jgi:uncharacterized phage infection (PIP) family protein YhgE